MSAPGVDLAHGSKRGSFGMSAGHWRSRQGFCDDHRCFRHAFWQSRHSESRAGLGGPRTARDPDICFVAKIHTQIADDRRNLSHERRFPANDPRSGLRDGGPALEAPYGADPPDAPTIWAALPRPAMAERSQPCQPGKLPLAMSARSNDVRLFSKSCPGAERRPNFAGPALGRPERPRRWAENR